MYTENPLIPISFPLCQTGPVELRRNYIVQLNFRAQNKGIEAEPSHVSNALRTYNYPQNVISNILKKKPYTQRTNSLLHHLRNLFLCFTNGPHPPHLIPSAQTLYSIT